MLECYGAVSTSLGPAGQVFIYCLRYMSKKPVIASLDCSGSRVTSIVYADRLRAGFNSKANMGFYRARQDRVVLRCVLHTIQLNTILMSGASCCTT